MFDYNVGLNEIVQLVIKTTIPPTDSNNNGKPAQEATKKSVEKESNNSFEKANGHVFNEDQVTTCLYFKLWNTLDRDCILNCGILLAGIAFPI